MILINFVLDFSRKHFGMILFQDRLCMHRMYTSTCVDKQLDCAPQQIFLRRKINVNFDDKSHLNKTNDDLFS